MRLTGLGRVVAAGVMGLALGVGIATSTPAIGQQGVGQELPRAKLLGEESVILAAILAFIQGAMMQAFQDMLIGNIFGGIKKGAQATVEQIAANTVGVQSALNQHLSGTIDGLTKQTQIAEESILKRTFGSLGNRILSTRTASGTISRTVTIGAQPPSGCRRTTDARVLEAARINGEQVQRSVSRFVSERNAAATTTASGAAVLKRDQSQYGIQAFSLDWLQKDQLSATEVDMANRSIAALTNPLPPPVPEGCRVDTSSQRLVCNNNNTASLGSLEYQAKYDAFRAAVKIPQDVLGRQLALRSGGNGDAFLKTIRGWAQRAVEDPLNPAVLQHKTEKGVLAELALSMNHLLWLETEQHRAAEERNQLLALIASDVLERRANGLRATYNETISAD